MLSHLLLRPFWNVHNGGPNDADSLVLLYVLLDGEIAQLCDDVALLLVFCKAVGQHDLQLFLGELLVLVVVQLQDFFQSVLLEGGAEIHLRLFRVGHEAHQVRFDVRFFDSRMEGIDALVLTPAFEHVDQKVKGQMVLH